MTERIRRHVTEANVCVLTFDRPDSAANIFDRETLEEFGRHLDLIAASPNLKGVVITSAKPSIFIAGADLAHMGTRFGDPEPIGPAALETIGREDRAMLEHVEAGDAEGFFESVRRDKDRRRICGLEPRLVQGAANGNVASSRILLLRRTGS